MAEMYSRDKDGNLIPIYNVSTTFAKPEQEKTVKITKNGQTVITPDDGKVLTKVIVNVLGVKIE